MRQQTIDVVLERVAVLADDRHRKGLLELAQRLAACATRIRRAPGSGDHEAAEAPHAGSDGRVQGDPLRAARHGVRRVLHVAAGEYAPILRFQRGADAVSGIGRVGLRLRRPRKDARWLVIRRRGTVRSTEKDSNQPINLLTNRYAGPGTIIETLPGSVVKIVLRKFFPRTFV